MNKIKFSLENIQSIALFESLTGAGVKDCINDTIFIIQQGDIGKAVGRNGMNIKRVQEKLKRKIKVFEFNPDPVQFVKNVVMPIKPKNIDYDEQNKIISINAPDSKSRGLLIGRNAQNLREYESIVKRYFDINEIKVL